MNSNIGFTAGNQYDVGTDNRLGYLASASYRLDYIYYDDFENNNYRKSADKSVNELELDKGQVGDIGKESVLFSGLAGLTFKTPKNKYKLTAMHIQNGISSALWLLGIPAHRAKVPLPQAGAPELQDPLGLRASHEVFEGPIDRGGVGPVSGETLGLFQ